MSIRALTKNEDGSVMVISIVILALLTVIGIAVTTTTSIELQIAANERIYKENFYRAEGAAMMLARVLENAVQTDVNKLKEDPPQFKDPGSGSYKTMPVKGKTGDIDTGDILADTYWEGTNDRSCEAPGFGTIDPPRFIARYNGIAPGSSLDMTGGTSVREYSVFGRRKYNNSPVVIALGYKNRF
jgi:hypothetical protein